MLETVQAKLVLVATLVILFLYTVFGYMLGKTMGNIILVLVIIIGLPIAVLLSYDINCLVVGKCNIWSWIRTILYLISVVFSVIGIVMMIIAIKGAKKQIVPNVEKKDETKQATQ